MTIMKEEKEVNGMGKYLSSHNALIEIGARIKAYRIDYPLSQAELANKSGIAVRSLSRMENGEDVQFGNLVKVLIALDLDTNLDMLIPDPKKRPSSYVKKIVPEKKRRVGRVARKTSKKVINWGDES